MRRRRAPVAAPQPEAPAIVSPAIGTVLVMTYGTAEIVAFDGAWRIEIYRPHKVHPSEPWTREFRERVMCAGHEDASARHDKMTAYDSRCSCCYLNISHTAAVHARALRSEVES